MQVIVKQCLDLIEKISLYVMLRMSATLFRHFFLVESNELAMKVNQTVWQEYILLHI